MSDDPFVEILLQIGRDAAEIKKQAAFQQPDLKSIEEIARQIRDQAAMMIGVVECARRTGVSIAEFS